MHGDLSSRLDPIGAVASALCDDMDAKTDFCLDFQTCQSRQWLSDNFLRRAARLRKLVPSGRSGWLKLWTTNDQGWLGAAINFHAAPKSSNSAFSQGRNLHRLTYSHASRLLMPVIPSKC